MLLFAWLCIIFLELRPIELSALVGFCSGGIMKSRNGNDISRNSNPIIVLGRIVDLSLKKLSFQSFFTYFRRIPRNPLIWSYSESTQVEIRYWHVDSQKKSIRIIWLRENATKKFCWRLWNIYSVTSNYAIC